MPATDARRLTAGERDLAASIFGAAIAYDRVRIHRRRYFPLHPKNAIMAPNGHLWVHPKSGLWSEDYSAEPLGLQGLFIHEMTHVWQAQTRGRWYLVLMRHPFCRYGYKYRPGWPLERYGLEQQGEIVRDIFLMQEGAKGRGTASLEALRATLPCQFAAEFPDEGKER